MSAHLRQNAFGNGFAPNVAGYENGFYQTTLAENDFFEDIFRPSWWRHYSSGTTAFRAGDIVRLRGADASFDFDVVVMNVLFGGAEVQYRCGSLPYEFHGLHATELAERFRKNEAEFTCCALNRDGRAIPRVEQMDLDKTWRAIGDNNEVVKAGLKSKSQADAELSRYLYALKLRFPTPAEMTNHVKEIQDREMAGIAAAGKRSPKR